MTMTPEELEVAYDQTKWASNMPDLLARFGVLSDAARKQVGEPARIAYGEAKQEAFDLYSSGGQAAPVVVFVHGGGWRGGVSREFGFPAEMLLANGIHFISVDFSSADETKGDLSILVDQVRRAVAWISKNCASFGGDPKRVYLTAHSSGGHLAAMALSTRWADYGLSENPIKGAVLVSGIYDLAPLRHTSRSKFVNIDDTTEKTLSPIRHTASITSSVIVGVGSKESPEFKRQAQEFAQAIAKAGNLRESFVAETYHHFDILETLGNPHGALGRRLLSLVNSDV